MGKNRPVSLTACICCPVVLLYREPNRAGAWRSVLWNSPAPAGRPPEARLRASEGLAGMELRGQAMRCSHGPARGLHGRVRPAVYPACSRARTRTRARAGCTMPEVMLGAFLLASRHGMGQHKGERPAMRLRAFQTLLQTHPWPVPRCRSVEVRREVRWEHLPAMQDAELRMHQPKGLMPCRHGEAASMPARPQPPWACLCRPCGCHGLIPCLRGADGRGAGAGDAVDGMPDGAGVCACGRGCRMRGRSVDASPSPARASCPCSARGPAPPMGDDGRQSIHGTPAQGRRTRRTWRRGLPHGVRICIMAPAMQEGWTCRPDCLDMARCQANRSARTTCPEPPAADAGRVVRAHGPDNPPRMVQPMAPDALLPARPLGMDALSSGTVRASLRASGTPPWACPAPLPSGVVVG